MPTQAAASFLSASNEERLQQLQSAVGYRLGHFLTMSTCYTYPLHLQVAKEQIRPHVVLLGNAAHTLHPIAGQGFNVGLRDLVALVEILTEAKQNSVNLNHFQLLEKYMNRRRQDQNRIVGFTDSIVRLFSNEFFATLGSMGFYFMNNMPLFKKRLIKDLLGYSREGKFTENFPFSTNGKLS